MASFSFAPDPASRRRIPIAEIDAAVCGRLGPTRGLGNSQPACFNRQVAMYLAKYVGGWTTTIIGRFYSGRDHSTVCYGIQRIEAMRDSDANVDALVGELRRYLLHQHGGHHDDKDSGDGRCKPVLPALNIEELADLIAERVYARLQERIHLFVKEEEQNHVVEDKASGNSVGASNFWSDEKVLRSSVALPGTDQPCGTDLGPSRARGLCDRSARRRSGQG